MPLILLTNSVWSAAARVVVTDNTYAETSEQTGLQSITGGHNHYSWSQSGTADRIVTYVNKAGGLSCTYAVVTHADAFNGHQVQILSYSTYSSSATTEYDSGVSFAQTLVGPQSKDWVKAVTISSKEGIGLNLTGGTGGNYAKTLYKVYFSTGFTLNYPGSVQVSPLPRHSRFLLKKQSFSVTEKWTFVAEAMTRTELQTLEQLPYLKTDAFFIYDADGTLISHKLLQCVLESYQVVGSFDNKYDIQFVVNAVNQY